MLTPNGVTHTGHVHMPADCVNTLPPPPPGCAAHTMPALATPWYPWSDIDWWLGEQIIIDQMMADPGLYSLVDEFFFEMHFQVTACAGRRRWAGLPTPLCASRWRDDLMSGLCPCRRGARMGCPRALICAIGLPCDTSIACQQQVPQQWGA